MKRTLGDFIISGSAVLTGIGILVALPFEVPDAGLQTLGDMTSAAFFPMLAAILITLSGIALGLRTFVLRHRDGGALLNPMGSRPLLMVAGFVVYIPLIHWLGMVSASAIAVLILPLVYGYRDYRWIVPITVLIPVSVYLLFEKVLKVLFPHGAVF